MLSILAFLSLIIVIIPLEHAALRGRGELARRAIGILTVMGLALLPVGAGVLDWFTWGVTLAGFLLAGGILSAMLWVEQRRDRAARVEETRRTLHEQIEQWTALDRTEEAR